MPSVSSFYLRSMAWIDIWEVAIWWYYVLLALGAIVKMVTSVIKAMND